MPTTRQQRIATLSLLVVTAIWGSTFVVVKDAVERMPVMDFLAWRFAIAAVVMAAVRPRAVSTLDRHGRQAGVLLGIALGGGYVAQTFGLERTPASVSGFITGLFVVFTPLCAGVILRKRIDGMTWLAVLLATVGLGLISLHGFSIGRGEAITLLCALAFALHIVGLGEWSSSYDAAGLAVVQLTTVAVVCIVVAAPSSLAPPPDWRVWGAVLLTAIAATAVAFFIQTWAQAHLPPTRAAVVMTMEPVFAGIFGVAVGGDSLTARVVVGAVLVLIAMYAVELGPQQAKDATVQRFE
ncbi:MAG: DMT family transporter [Frankiaceae bacterium]|nr:DMT family transporter [Frankiaceae bacterium]MBV9872679.1 DMT family transporter [Frankiaceae bacterium]